MTAVIEAIARRHRQTSADQCGCLPDVADRIHSEICKFWAAPNAVAAERLAIELEGIRLHFLRIRETLVREADGPRG